MSMISRSLAASVCVVSLLRVVSLAAQNPVAPPPVKPGLWETRISQLDANGQEVPSPELAALAKLPPEMRARMAEAMRARGVQMPDENGTVKACVTRETLDAGTWQQLASDSGCTTTFSTRSSSSWKWHSSCPSLNAESDGETVFGGPENYRTKVTTTATVGGRTNTTTRIVDGKWRSDACGDIKPLTPTPPPPARGR